MNYNSAPNALKNHLASIAVHHSDVIEWINELYQEELAALPYQTENLARSQGRCQVFKEFLLTFESAKAAMAKS